MATIWCLRVGWTVALVLAIGAHYVLNNVFSPVRSFRIQMHTHVALVAILYGWRYFCCSKNQYSPLETKEDKVADGSTEMVSVNHTTCSVIPSESTCGSMSASEQQQGVALECSGDDVEQPMDDAEGKLPKGSSVLRVVTSNDGSSQARQRLFFLDNVKTFLTFMVVTFHVNCSFGGCFNYHLVLGKYQSKFHWAAYSFAALNQAYFMSLFFLIAGYFATISYDRKGKVKFLMDKAKRLYIPTLVVIFALAPLTRIVAHCIVGMKPTGYYPYPDHCWFTLWLLVFHWVYSTFGEASASSSKSVRPTTTTTTTSRPFPSTRLRLVVGFIICGAVTGLFILYIGKTSAGLSFYSMPVTLGSLFCDMLLFYVGTLASRHQWFVPSIRENLDIDVWALRLCVFLEAAAMVPLLILQKKSFFTFGVPLVGISGFYCCDMSLAILQFFQEFANSQNRITKALADSAYTVYLIHILFVVVNTGIFIKVYNALFGDVIEFHSSSSPVSNSRLHGPWEGQLHLLIGWIIVVVATHLIVWPLAWCIRQLPGFNRVL